MKNEIIMNYSEIVQYANELHDNQDYDGHSYEYHLLTVAGILLVYGIPSDSPILFASVLHDTLEDTNVSYNDLARKVGFEVANIVYDVTNELGKNRKERAEKTYPKIAANPKAILVKLADRMANTLYSRDTRSSMYTKYLQEYPTFKKNLYNEAYFEEYPVMKTLWEVMDDIYDGIK